MTDWMELSARASMASHRLVGWIYWDPVAIQRYGALGVPDAFGYYVASRGAPLAAAGHQAVAAAFYSIHPGFIELCLSAAEQHTTYPQITEARDAAVGIGLRTHVPEICDDLASMGPALWEIVDGLPSSGRVLFAAHRQWPRSDDPVVSAWLALNCIRERRGDSHFAVLAAEGIDGTQAGLLHDAHLRYPGEWIPRSRGADDTAIEHALHALESRGLASGGRVNDAGLELRQRIEDRTNELSQLPWRLIGERRTVRYLDLVEPVGERLVARIDQTAGPDWMPAAREPRG